MTKSTIQYSILKAAIEPIWQISDRLGYFAITALIYATVLTCLSNLFAFTMDCSFSLSAGQNACTNYGGAYIFYLFLTFTILASFINTWITPLPQASDLDSKFSITLIRQNMNAVFKNLILIALFLTANALPMLSAFILYYRQPNPVWQIELLFFTAIGLGLLAPFALMRFYAYLGERLEGQARHPVFASWRNTRGFIFKILFSVMLLYIFLLILYIGAHAQDINNLGILGDLIQNIIMLLSTALIVNFMRTQKNFFLP